MTTFIIAEVGVNHNGSLEQALKMIKVAKESGADAVKFQTFKAKLLVTKDAQKANYQSKNTTSEGTQYQMLKDLELSMDDYKIIKKHCELHSIEFISTPFDTQSVKLLNNLNVHRFKIGSGDLTNFQLLKEVALTNKPIILSTGMSNINEIIQAVNIIKKYNSLPDLTLLHCISAYPTPDKDCNMLSITTIKENISNDIQVGFSDHTHGSRAAIIAVSLGATCIEKHFTLDKNMDGPDHLASLSPDELSEYIKDIKSTELMMGTGIKRCMHSETNTREVARRSIAVHKNLKKGHVLGEEDLICLRPYSGISAIHFFEIVGQKLKKSVKKYQLLKWGDLE